MEWCRGTTLYLRRHDGEAPIRTGLWKDYTNMYRNWRWRLWAMSGKQIACIDVAAWFTLGDVEESFGESFPLFKDGVAEVKIYVWNLHFSYHTDVKHYSHANSFGGLNPTSQWSVKGSIYWSLKPFEAVLAGTEQSGLMSSYNSWRIPNSIPSVLYWRIFAQ